MSDATAKTTHWLEGLHSPDFPNEYETKQLLTYFGVTAPRGLLLFPGDNPVEAVREKQLTPPLIAKVCSGKILHKTEMKGVIFNLDCTTLPEAVEDLRRRFSGKKLLVEEQIRYQGGEFILGAMNDPSLGPALMVGAGGVLTEIYKDVVFRLAPCSKEECLFMLKELTLAPLFEGYRNIELDASSLAEIISSLGDLILALGDRFYQLDINPIVFNGAEWISLDAKIILKIRE